MAKASQPAAPSTTGIGPGNEIWNTPLPTLLDGLTATPTGLSSEEAWRRLDTYGPNTLSREDRFQVLRSLFRLFANPLVVILLVASAVSQVLGERLGGLIIIVMVLLSVALNFLMEYQAQRAAEEIRKQVATKATALRDGREVQVPPAELVPGDVVRLNAGDLVPADCRLLEARDLHVRESALTGESLPVEKSASDPSSVATGPRSLSEANNCVFLGTSVQTGITTAVVVRTGFQTQFGTIAARLGEAPPASEFARGLASFGLLITRVTMLLVVFVLLVNVSLHRPLLESLLFSIALAVGMTPELMPMIFTVSLARAARRMTSKKVLVKQLAAIEDLGSIEILCSDKTGTLTEGEIILDRHVDITGADSEDVLRYVYLNSLFEAGIKSPLDDAVLKHDPPNITGVRKVDEIPFDFQRKRLSVAVDTGAERLLLSKGEVESILGVCTRVMDGGQAVEFSPALREQALATYRNLSSEGFRTLGVAIATVPTQETYSAANEREMTLMGFAAFLDPPKKGIPEVLAELNRTGIRVVILTGDNQYVTERVVRQVGLDTSRLLTGPEVDALDEAALAFQAENGAIFARVSPEQKTRIILALKSRGHVVGFLGDGINDSPSLHTADVGISVENGVDVAKEAAKIILLEKDLSVICDGVIEGRRCFANIMKYIIMGTSSNFGNMFSMAAAALFLPFLPMLPTQILLNNFLYDLSQLAIAGDNVDTALLQHPKRWRIGFIRQFMTIVGPISSLFDLLTFGLLLYGFSASANASLFHTGWFVESLATQTLVVFVIRTAASPFQSRPSRGLLLSVLAIVGVAMVMPYTPFGTLLGFIPLPVALLATIIALALAYLGVIQMVKSWFYRRHALL